MEMKYDEFETSEIQKVEKTSERERERVAQELRVREGDKSLWTRGEWVGDGEKPRSSGKEILRWDQELVERERGEQQDLKERERGRG